MPETTGGMRPSGRVLRLMSCRWCGHRLRFGARTCSECYQATPLLNRAAFWWGVGGVLLGVPVVGTALLFLIL